LGVSEGWIFCGCTCEVGKKTIPQDEAVLVVEFMIMGHDGFHGCRPGILKKGINPSMVLKGDKLLRC